MMAIERGSEVGAGSRRVPKLWQVVVVGGLALAAGCSPMPKRGEGSGKSGDDSGNPPPAKPAPPSGVQGW